MNTNMIGFSELSNIVVVLCLGLESRLGITRVTDIIVIYIQFVLNDKDLNVQNCHQLIICVRSNPKLI